ncbi:MAG: undecaprenyldiphospho-muramoylpentapeptide beta-N-acetylglucosaminyltransferase [Prolixibacteraceae bacterium]|jgi:UDP-N-acetylglucosamine--N-acetylmuramyl-(pentapeptide) pyrophosphoryl-undecaprenol N-acetylglucosamine transferase|nr:undecaprenyldiphospho-muramoylpentapeptide beta-N-acetylglucosaminyltransferase [Bacteroidota bacterium]NLS98457.1 undecaprenyldiphospho-muramoylpentapeptide beta-N-acetylglucosaminyltransferase [Bacteroidales bacterium]OQB82278.1 MAG: UDP-N-acetylglucosamine--N-acetylmuramyl-(pentapeptide) pyrophosphoryl-undecaprenol N-acetylglucosamine transferase [Bacteroidetes bacterium ADurb.Bin123]HNZ69457.1 undecaprenyldiphospho-muramoylpentapeptide beta-N-acetylglucosaminyltransferase [Prolixibacterac
MKEPKIIISGGGTGGHIFPALSIAGELRKRLPGCDILFVGAKGRMEMEKVPAAGYPITGLPVMGFPRKPGILMVKFFIMLFRSMVEARRIIRRFNPDLAIGVGGYASGPILRAAIARKVPALIQEQNSFAGKTNKILGKKVDRICVAYEGMERFFPGEKIILTGNPVRQNLLNPGASREEALAWFGFSPEEEVLLILGGSLGARSLNNAVLKNLNVVRKAPFRVIWQTGSLYYEEMVEKTRENRPGNLRIHRFLDRMEMAYLAADMVISRAGAGTISELCLVGKPAILVPSPNVAEDHQTRNARALQEKDAAILIRDGEIDEKLFPAAVSLMNDKERLAQLSENIRRMALPGATAGIVDEALKLLNV